ncbi:MAG TPA: HAMP domain-containing sensor histidine kinase [Streptosporangiaceae bacterium]|nr:HAMP domain-containing sensor histidine kinase [Streptosporangiaceae bacterium]
MPRELLAPQRALHWPHHGQVRRPWPALRRSTWVRPRGHRWAWVDAAWVVFAAANLVAVVVFPYWETIPFHFIWVSLTFLYGFRVWSRRPTAWILAAVVLTTGAAIGWDVWRGAQTADELNEVPLMAVMFWLMVWHAQRKRAADIQRDLVSQENARLLAAQRRFLQDTSHQVRTPITLALGHAELLASQLAGRPEQRDIQVVVGELERLRRLGERLLMIATSEDPDFLRPEPLALDDLLLDLLAAWLPTAPRCWRVGKLDAAVVSADRERLTLAVEALLENAVRHTDEGALIELSVMSPGPGRAVLIGVRDSGEGIAPAELEYIFERFRTGSQLGGVRGTGLGLALVRAVARAHGGDVLVSSSPGKGSDFQIVLPAVVADGGQVTPGSPGTGQVPAGSPGSGPS